MSPVDVSKEMDAIRLFNCRRGELIPAMLEDGIRLFTFPSKDWEKFYFDNIELIGEYWIVTATEEDGEELTLRLRATKEEIDIYNKVKAYGELCAEYGVKR